MKKLFVLLYIASVSSMLCAQNLEKATRQATKALVESPAVAKRTLSRYGGARGAVMGVDYYLQYNMPKATVSAPASNRSWLEQQKRNRKAYQLHQQRRVRDARLEQELSAQLARQAMLDKLPQANLDHQFVVDDFTALIPEQMPTAEVPLVAGPGMLFRGLALPADGKAVQNILQNGLRVADVGTEANTRNLAIAGAMPGMGKALAHTPMTNLTSFPTEAAGWAVTRFTEGKPLLAVVAVNGQTQSGKVVLVAHDIPAGQITHVFVPLNVNGQVAWCQIELTENGQFLVTPYDIASLQ